MRQIRKTEFEKGYAPLNRVGSVATDSAFLDDLVGIEAKYSGAEGSFPGAAPQKVGNLVKNYTVDKFQASDALTAIKTLREDATGNFRSGDTSLGNAQMAMANALENQIERALTAANNPNAAKMLEQFRLSRQRMAISHSVEDAIKDSSTVNRRCQIESHAKVQCLSIDDVVVALSVLIVSNADRVNDPGNKMIALYSERTFLIVLNYVLEISL
jgi:hypothetical protein